MNDIEEQKQYSLTHEFDVPPMTPSSSPKHQYVASPSWDSCLPASSPSAIHPPLLENLSTPHITSDRLDSAVTQVLPTIFKESVDISPASEETQEHKGS